ncbi:uncharacterized protein PG998_008475 [Apiospora kogelbergensis]|uniref:uncharacterized protein n=1 Tax=Apiospora kogelbergensis TaxID=1337665 RepID=UPI00312F72B3
MAMVSTRTVPLHNHQPRRPATRHEFEIAVICAFVQEADAAEALFDHHWEDDGPPYDKAPGDPNAYSTGSIGRHNVVLTYMPGIGKVNATTVAANCRISFPNIRLAVIVGICGVVPFTRDGHEIVLGDVVISDGVIQYDLGRRMPEGFVRKDTLLDSLGRPNTEIRSILAKLQGFRGRKILQKKAAEYLAVIQQEPGLAAQYPGSKRDKLFDAGYRHVTDGKLCDDCGCDGPLIKRSRLDGDSQSPAIHFGLIASGDTVLKSGVDRDEISQKEGVIAFEMVSAGVWDLFPCVVIKGACDYADSHNMKAWQHYAAATAAACMKAFLDSWVPSSPSIPEPPRVIEPIAKTSSSDSNLRTACIVSIPSTRNTNFTGRTAILEEMENKLFVRGDRQRLAIVGLGGVGKTQLALQFAHLVREKHSEYSIFWVPVLSVEGFDQAYLDIGKKLGVGLDPDKEKPNDTIRNHLSSENAGKWLLIVDNADDTELIIDSSGIYDYLPESETGLILFTTRSMEVAVEVAGTDVIELHEMDDGEARDLLKKSLLRKQPMDEGIVAELLRELAYLPLAITQAAAYLNRNQLSIRRYLALLRGTEKDLVELMSKQFRDNTRYQGSQNAVATTWLVSFDQIQASNGTAAELLSFISCIEPKSIPRSLLSISHSEIETTEAIGTLSGYSFLIDRGDGELYDIHSLVHLATRIWLRKNKRTEKTILNAIQHLDEILPFDDYSNRQTWQGYLSHTARLLGMSGMYQSKARVNILYHAGRCLISDRRFKDAIKYLQEACDWHRESLPETNKDRLSLEHALGGAYIDDRRTTEAIEVLEHVVSVRKTTLDEEDQDRLASEHQLAEHELARAYLDMDDKRIPEAIEILEHVVETRKMMIDEEDQYRLTSEHELARAYLKNSQPRKAVHLFEHVVAVRKTTMTEEDSSRLSSEAWLANAYMDNNEAQKAVNLLEHIVAVEKTIMKEEDSSRLISEHELARAYLDDGQAQKAVDLLEHVVALRKITLKDKDHERLVSEHNLARAYLGNNQTKKAIDLLEHVVAVESQILDKEDPDRILLLELLEDAYEQLAAECEYESDDS